MVARYTLVGTGIDITAIPVVAPNKGGHPRNERLEALYARAARWLAEDASRKTRDAAKLIAPEYRDDWNSLLGIEQNERVNDIRKRIDAYLFAVEQSAR